LVLKAGESAFISANESPVNVSGTGRLARVYNKL
jgi:mannose-6-phosphate isomerase